MTGTSSPERANQESRMEEKTFRSWDSGVGAPGEWLLEVPAENAKSLSRPGRIFRR